MLWDYELPFLTQANTFLLGKESKGRGKRLIEWQRVGAAEAESKTSAWKVNLRCRTFTGCHSSSSFRYMLSLHVNKQWHQVRKGFIAFLLDYIAYQQAMASSKKGLYRFDVIACQQAMTSCKKGVYRFLTWWHCLSTFLVESELILHNKSACQHGMLILKKEHKSCIVQFYGLWAKLDGHFFSVLQP